MIEERETLLQAVTGAAPFQQRSDGLWMNAPDLDVVEAASQMMKHGARLSTMTGVALEGDETQVIYHFALGKTSINLCVQTHGNHLPSITPRVPAANWPEREIADLFSTTFEGHPNPARLIRPPQLQPGYFREPGGAAGKAIRDLH